MDAEAPLTSEDLPEATMEVAVCHRHKGREVRLESALDEPQSSKPGLPGVEGSDPTSMYFHCPACGVDVRVELLDPQRREEPVP